MAERQRQKPDLEDEECREKVRRAQEAEHLKQINDEIEQRQQEETRIKELEREKKLQAARKAADERRKLQEENKRHEDLRKQKLANDQKKVERLKNKKERLEKERSEDERLEKEKEKKKLEEEKEKRKLKEEKEKKKFEEEKDKSKGTKEKAVQEQQKKLEKGAAELGRRIDQPGPSKIQDQDDFINQFEGIDKQLKNQPRLTDNLRESSEKFSDTEEYAVEWDDETFRRRERWAYDVDPEQRGIAPKVGYLLGNSSVNEPSAGGDSRGFYRPAQLPRYVSKGDKKHLSEQTIFEKYQFDFKTKETGNDNADAGDVDILQNSSDTECIAKDGENE